MKRLLFVLALMLVPSVASAGYAFAHPKKAAKVQVDVRQHAECDPSYPTVCIPLDARDLDCGDIGFANFAVVGDDPHGFDSDGDGVGCESWRDR